MKKSKSYGLIIKELLDVTDTKFTVLAKAVGYDISYISKWCNNIKIPSIKNIETVNSKLAQFFSEEVIKQGKIEDINKSFEIRQYTVEHLAKKELLYEVIYKILETGYKNSKSDFCQKTENTTEDNKIIIGNKKITSFVTDLLRTTIESSTDDIEIISTLDICKTTSNINPDMIEGLKMKNIRVNAKVALDMSEFESNPNFYIPRIYFILNECLNIEFDFYDNKELDKLNIIAIKNKFAIICSLNLDGIMEVATVIMEQDKVNAIYEQVSIKFRTESLLIKSTEFLGMDKGGYRTEFYSNDEFQFISTRGFEFLLPYEIINEIINDVYNQGLNEDTAFFIKKIQITWEEVFEKSKINFIILKSALMKYFEDGEIFYAEVNYKVTPEQRKKHALNVLECMRNNKDIKITVLDDELLNHKLNFFKISVYVNNRKIFLKKNRKSESNSAPLYYTIINEKFVKLINEYLTSLKDRDYCVEYDLNATERIIEKYGTMIQRILDANTMN